MEDREREKSLLDGLSEKTEDNARVLMMSDGKEELGWVAKRGVDEMCRDAWRWQSQNPNGYRG